MSVAIRTELATRTLSAIALGAAVLFITWWHPVSFAAMCLLGGAILAREWWGLTKHRSRWFILLGVVYIGSAVGSLIFLRVAGAALIYLLFALVWTADIAAYLVGKACGRHKIAPRISPGKSWEGLGGAVIASAVLLLLLCGTNDDLLSGGAWAQALAIGSGFAVTGLLGDLFESALKRHAGVKDSGKLIPGHGGLFDRVDALMACAILLTVLLFISSLVTLMGSGMVMTP